MSKNNGITLVTLVVTIIILLILAGITISMVLGQNGIFKKAETAKEATTKSQALEKVRLGILEEITSRQGKKEGITPKQIEKRVQGSVVNNETTFPCEIIVDGIVMEIDIELTVSVKGNAPVEDTQEEQFDGISNRPKLEEGMIPIKYNGSNWVITSEADTEWYCYTAESKKWANVMLSDGMYKAGMAQVGQIVQEADIRKYVCMDTKI